MAYLGVDHTEENPKSFEEWGVLKEKIRETGQIFPNLPYYKDINGYVCETDAILIHIIQKSGRKELLGKQGNDTIIVRMIEGVLSDCQAELLEHLQSASQNNGKSEFEAMMDTSSLVGQKILKLNNRLEKNSPFLLVYLTIADFHLYDVTTYVFLLLIKK